jgi:hypothetical protein
MEFIDEKNRFMVLNRARSLLPVRAAQQGVK